MPTRGGQSGDYNFYALATGDYAPVDDFLFIPSVNGLYQFSVFAENTDGGAAAGDLVWEIAQGATSLGNNTYGLFGATPVQLGESFENQNVVAGTAVVFRRSIALYAGGNSNYRIHAVAVLLA